MSQSVPRDLSGLCSRMLPGQCPSVWLRRCPRVWFGQCPRVWVSVLMVVCLYHSVASASTDVDLKISLARDTCLLVGSDLTIDCYIKTDDTVGKVATAGQPLYNVSFLAVVRNGTAVTDVTYDQESLSVRYHVRNVTSEYSGYYICRYGDLSTFQTLRNVQIGEPPEMPDQLVCISRNFEDLSCSFKEPESTIPIHWSMQYRFERSQPWLNFTESQCGGSGAHHWCGWPSYTDAPDNTTPFNTMVDYYIRVTVTNLLGSSSANVTFSHDDKNWVKPTPFTSVTATDISSREVKLNLVPDLSSMCCFSEPVFRLQLSTREGWDNRTVQLDRACEVSDEDVGIEDTVSLTLTDLVPYSQYEVTASCKPKAAKGEIYWSDPRSVRFQTADDVPCAPTQLTAGSFVLMECNQGRLCVVLYWKNPSRKCRNGEINGYQVSVKAITNPDQASQRHLQVQTHNATPNVSTEAGTAAARYAGFYGNVMWQENVLDYRVFVVLNGSMQMGSAYLLGMKARTRAGYSEGRSTVVVPEWSRGKDLRVDSLVVETDVRGNRDRVSWSLADEICGNITSITVFWCPKDQQNVTNKFINCKGTLDWYTIETVNACDNCSNNFWNSMRNQSVVYAVSVASGEWSGGMVWEQHRYVSFAAPAKPVFSVNPDFSHGTSVNVTLTYGKVNDGGRPETHEVVYQETSKSSSTSRCPEDAERRNYTVDFNNPVLVVDQLTPDTKYIICVRSINHVAGRFAKPQVVHTLPLAGDEKQVEIWRVLVGICAGVIGIVLVIYVIYRLVSWRKAMKIEIGDPSNGNKPKHTGRSQIDAEKKLEGKMQMGPVVKEHYITLKDSGGDSGHNSEQDKDSLQRLIADSDDVNTATVKGSMGSGYLIVENISGFEVSDTVDVSCEEGSDAFSMQTTSYSQATDLPREHVVVGQDYMPDSAANSPVIGTNQGVGGCQSGNNVRKSRKEESVHAEESSLQGIQAVEVHNTSNRTSGGMPGSNHTTSRNEDFEAQHMDGHGLGLPEDKGDTNASEVSYRVNQNSSAVGITASKGKVDDDGDMGEGFVIHALNDINLDDDNDHEIDFEDHWIGDSFCSDDKDMVSVSSNHGLGDDYIDAGACSIGRSSLTSCTPSIRSFDVRSSSTRSRTGSIISEVETSNKDKVVDIKEVRNKIEQLNQIDSQPSQSQISNSPENTDHVAEPACDVLKQDDDECESNIENGMSQSEGFTSNLAGSSLGTDISGENASSYMCATGSEHSSGTSSHLSSGPAIGIKGSDESINSYPEILVHVEGKKNGIVKDARLNGVIKSSFTHL